MAFTPSYNILDKDTHNTLVDALKSGGIGYTEADGTVHKISGDYVEGGGSGSNSPFAEVYGDMSEEDLETYSVYADAELQHKLTTVEECLSVIGDKLPLLVFVLEGGETDKMPPISVETDGTNFYTFSILWGADTLQRRIYGVDGE